MKKFSTDEIIILLGAGASVDSGILNSQQMILKIESRLGEAGWQRYASLYHYLKSVFYQKEIARGKVVSLINFNIENLVGLLDLIVEISKADSEFYTFVGSWEKDLQGFIKDERDNELVSDFKEVIIKELRGDWLFPTDWIKRSQYYSRLVDFKNEFDGFPLKIFSLNYDQCVEQNIPQVDLQLGFDEYNKWSARRYDYGDTNEVRAFYLYKLHGSIDWKKTTTEGLVRMGAGDIKTDELAIIFGLANKLQSYDPYLFYFYEFRSHCAAAQLIICSGYGFLDEHINEALKYGLKEYEAKKLVVNCFDEGKPDQEIAEEVAARLGISAQQVAVYNKKASSFFTDDLKLSNFEAMFTEEEGSLPPNF